MRALIKLIIIDYLVSWTIAAELCLLLAFLVIVRYSSPMSALTGLGMIGFFSLAVTPISVRRLTNRAWSAKSRYLVATNLGRRGYFFALAITSFLINTAVLLAAFAGVWALNSSTFDLTGTAKSFALLAALVALNISLCMVLSKLTAPRVGALLSIGLIVLLGLGDENSLKSASAKAAIHNLQLYGPHLKPALDMVVKKSAADWPLTALQLGGFTALFLVLTALIFRSKELLFEE